MATGTRTLLKQGTWRVAELFPFLQYVFLQSEWRGVLEKSVVGASPNLCSMSISPLQLSYHLQIA